MQGLRFQMLEIDEALPELRQALADLLGPPPGPTNELLARCAGSAQRHAEAARMMERRCPAFVKRDRTAGRASRRNDRQAPAAPSPAFTR